MKKVFKYFGYLMLTLLLIAGLLFIQIWYFKPFNINLFFGKTALQFVLKSPEALSSLRVLEPLGIKGHNAKLDDASMEAGDEMMAKLQETYDTLMSYEDADLNPADKMSKDVMHALLEVIIENQRFRFHNYPVNQLFGVQSNFPSFMESTHQIDTVGDAEDYISRLEAIDRQFDQVLEGLKHREQLGILPPQFVVTKVLSEMRDFVATPAEEGILMKSMLRKMEDAQLNSDKQQKLAQSAKQVINEQVYPAYQKLIDYFVRLDKKVEFNRGVWSLPDGDDFYASALKLFTTTDATAIEIHQYGLAEVDRIQAEILTVLEQEGWEVSEGFTQSINNLANSEQFYYSDSAEGRMQILAEYEDILKEVTPELIQKFYHVPAAEMEVQRIPEFKEKTSPGAYYQSAAMDGSRPGIFYANLYDIKATPKYSMQTLAYHEGIPGHHFQIAIQQEQKDLPFFRRLIPFTAYSEGWALYAEQLAFEMGMYDGKPYGNIGRLQAELFRAVRLVVDTGIHAQRWSRERAIEYMLANTGMAESDVEAEIERYFVMPGQATAYKMGMRHILMLRERAQKALGKEFDIRDFHSVILNNGAVPLTIMEQLVDEYIAEQKT